jgi:heme exporter protein A
VNQPAAVLEARDVDVWRGERCLVQGLSFSLSAGQMALVVGPNGAGKTSLLRLLAGLAPCIAGRITWNSVALEHIPPEGRAEIVYRGHLDALKKDLTVAENLALCAALRRQPGGFDDLLAALGLWELKDRQVRLLSAGQRRRTGLACMRVAAARLWLLDEPLTNLDSAGRATVGGWLDSHLRGGGLAVVATHEPGELGRPGMTLVEL